MVDILYPANKNYENRSQQNTLVMEKLR